MTETEDAVRAWAKGSYPLEAGVELLIRHGKAIYDGAPWLRTSEYEPGKAALNIDVLLDETGAWSGGEQRIVRIAASLLGGPSVDLYEELPGLDRRCTRLVLAAVAHAQGSHEDTEVILDPETGAVKSFKHAKTLYPWPEEN